MNLTAINRIKYSIYTTQLQALQVDCTASQITNPHIRSDFLTNLHQLNRLLADLPYCPVAMVKQARARLYIQPDKPEPHPGYLIMAFVWFGLSDVTRAKIAGNRDKAPLFWQTFNQVCQVKVIEYQLTDYQYVLPAGGQRSLRRTFYRQCSNTIAKQNEPNRDWIITAKTDPALTIWPEPTQYTLKTSIISLNQCSLTEEFTDVITAKATALDEVNQQASTLQQLKTMLTSLTTASHYQQNKEHLTVEETAQFLRVAVKTVYGYSSSKLLTSYTLDGKKKYFKKSEIVKLLEGKQKRSQTALRQQATRLLSG